MQTRRDVLTRIGYLGIALLTVPVACLQNSRDPVPFQTGEVVSPPIGCTELLEADKDGDC